MGKRTLMKMTISKHWSIMLILLLSMSLLALLAFGAYIIKPPPPPIGYEEPYYEEPIQPTKPSYEGGPIPTGPPPLIATISGNITGIEKGDVAYLEVISLDFDIRLGVNVPENGPWKLDLPAEGMWEVIAKTDGYDSSPKFYRFKASKGDVIAGLDFTFYKMR